MAPGSPRTSCRASSSAYRAGTGGSRPGSGLGLAIVAEVAAAHGGTAEAAPVSPHGLRIALTLPGQGVSQPAAVPSSRG